MTRSSKKSPRLSSTNSRKSKLIPKTLRQE